MFPDMVLEQSEVGPPQEARISVQMIVSKRDGIVFQRRPDTSYNIS